MQIAIMIKMVVVMGKMRWCLARVNLDHGDFTVALGVTMPLILAWICNGSNKLLGREYHSTHVPHLSKSRIDGIGLGTIYHIVQSSPEKGAGLNANIAK